MHALELIFVIEHVWHGQVIPDSNVVGSLISLATIVAETDPLLQYWFPVGDTLALACIAT